MPVARIASLCVLTVALSISVVTDVRSKKIYNWVTLPGIVLGLLLQTWAGWGQDMPFTADFGWRSSLAGCGLGFGVFAIAWLLGGLGEGDVKLMGAVGALAGFPVTFVSLFTIALAGGVEALIVLLWRRKLMGTLRGIARDAAATAGLAEREVRERGHVPYGVAIAAGTAWAFWWVREQDYVMAALGMNGRG